MWIYSPVWVIPSVRQEMVPKAILLGRTVLLIRDTEAFWHCSRIFGLKRGPLSELWCPEGHCCSSGAKLCLTLCSTPGFPVLHYLSDFAHTHVHWVDEAMQPSHPLSQANGRNKDGSWAVVPAGNSASSQHFGKGGGQLQDLDLVVHNTYVAQGTQQCHVTGGGLGLEIPDSGPTFSPCSMVHPIPGVMHPPDPLSSRTMGSLGSLSGFPSPRVSGSAPIPIGCPRANLRAVPVPGVTGLRVLRPQHTDPQWELGAAASLHFCTFTMPSASARVPGLAYGTLLALIAQMS